MNKTFTAQNPVTGESVGAQIAEWDQSQVLKVINSAHNVKHKLARTSPNERASVLNSIANAIEAEKDNLAQIANLETALPLARLNGEIMRTVIQLRAFANLVESGGHLLPIIDLADPNFLPVARPDLRKSQQPLGVVAVFAASNFPFAFSVAGGDTAAALAAGCPVVVKAHPSHPNTSQLVYEAVTKALETNGLPKDLFSIVQGANPEITHWLAQAPEITAIGFTGSALVGKLLLKLAQERSVPIPVYAEMGSLNPVFITPSALGEKIEELAKATIDSALLGSGQFCTKPGIIIIPSNTLGDNFIDQIKKYVSQQKVAPLLNKGIADRFKKSINKLSNSQGIEVISGVANEEGFGVTPNIFISNWSEIGDHSELLEEHFGPTSVIIRAPFEEYLNVAKSMPGQLTATIHSGSEENVSEIVNQLSQIAGRVIWNGFPTAVSVTAAQNHGGQWPASSTHTTSVGLDAIYRFVRPVVYQNFPDNQLPLELQNSNPYGIERLVNSSRTNKPIS